VQFVQHIDTQKKTATTKQPH